MKRFLQKLIKEFLWGLLIAIAIIGILYVGKSTRAYGLYISSGASVEPYCLNCLGFYVNIKPIENSDIVYKVKFNDIEMFAVHPFLYETTEKYYACINQYKDSCLAIDEINKEDYRGRIIFELPLETTESFLLACLKELDGSKLKDKIDFCLEWERDYNKFKDEADN
ncbi:MAG: hypothetical protein AABY22_24785 [Nanoarchaeota archaeon]